MRDETSIGVMGLIVCFCDTSLHLASPPVCLSCRLSFFCPWSGRVCRWSLLMKAPVAASQSVSQSVIVRPYLALSRIHAQVGSLNQLPHLKPLRRLNCAIVAL